MHNSRGRTHVRSRQEFHDLHTSILMVGPFLPAFFRLLSQVTADAQTPASAKENPGELVTNFLTLPRLAEHQNNGVVGVLKTDSPPRLIYWFVV